MHGRQTGTLSGSIEPAKLMVAQRQGAVAPFDIGAGALEHLGQRLGLLVQRAVFGLAQRGLRPTGRIQRRAQTRGQLPQRLACLHRACLGHALERAGRHELRVEGVGHRWCHVALRDLWPHRPRDTREGRRHCGQHALGLLEALQARLAQPCVRGNGAHRVHRLVEIRRNALPSATHTARHIDTVVRLAERAETLCDLRALGAEAQGLVASPCRCLRERLQACGGLWRAPRTVVLRLAACALQWASPLRKPLVRLGGGLAGRPVLRGHGA